MMGIFLVADEKSEFADLAFFNQFSTFYPNLNGHNLIILRGSKQQVNLPKNLRCMDF